jgi:hypothetical protein
MIFWDGWVLKTELVKSPQVGLWIVQEGSDVHGKAVEIAREVALKRLENANEFRAQLQVLMTQYSSEVPMAYKTPRKKRFKRGPNYEWIGYLEKKLLGDVWIGIPPK